MNFLGETAKSAIHRTLSSAEPMVEAGQQDSFFCSELVAAGLQAMGVLPADFNANYFWPGTFAPGGALDGSLANGFCYGSLSVIDYHRSAASSRTTSPVPFTTQKAQASFHMNDSYKSGPVSPKPVTAPASGVSLSPSSQAETASSSPSPYTSPSASASTSAAAVLALEDGNADNGADDGSAVLLDAPKTNALSGNHHYSMHSFSRPSMMLRLSSDPGRGMRYSDAGSPSGSRGSRGMAPPTSLDAADREAAGLGADLHTGEHPDPTYHPSPHPYSSTAKGLQFEGGEMLQSLEEVEDLPMTSTNWRRKSDPNVSSSSRDVGQMGEHGVNLEQQTDLLSSIVGSEDAGFGNDKVVVCVDLSDDEDNYPDGIHEHDDDLDYDANAMAPKATFVPRLF
jgi:hypothetical protein